MQVDNKEFDDLDFWPDENYSSDVITWQCNECAAQWQDKPKYAFCPFCGENTIAPVYGDETNIDLIDNLNTNAMKSKTVTTLGTLRIGDRFKYPKKVEVLEVIYHSKGTTAVNLPGDAGFIHKYDTIKRSGTQVIFLRHTKPLPGEECLLQDLETGDVFCLREDIITEYTLLEYKEKKHISVAVNSEASAVAAMVATDTVILIRKGKTVKL